MNDSRELYKKAQAEGWALKDGPNNAGFGFVASKQHANGKTTELHVGVCPQKKELTVLRYTVDGVTDDSNRAVAWLEGGI